MLEGKREPLDSIRYFVNDTEIGGADCRKFRSTFVLGQRETTQGFQDQKTDPAPSGDLPVPRTGFMRDTRFSFSGYSKEHGF